MDPLQRLRDFVLVNEPDYGDRLHAAGVENWEGYSNVKMNKQ